MQGEAALYEAGQRAAWFVRQIWPRYAEKELQRQLGLSEATAERVLAGRISKSVLEKLLRTFGLPFMTFVFAPYIGAGGDDIGQAAKAADIALRAELIEIKDRLARLERGPNQKGSDASTPNPAGADNAASASGHGAVARHARRAMGG